MRGKLSSGLTIFGLFTAVGLLLTGYKYLDFGARAIPIAFSVPLVEELTGAWTVALLFPAMVRFARRFPIRHIRSFPLHLACMAAFSFIHTLMMWGSRSLVFPLLGLGPYNYGIMRMRFPMEFFNDVIVYWVIVSILYLWDRQVRSAQLETKLAEARLQNLRLQLQPHFLFNALNTISSVNISPDVQQALVPQLLLQPLVENSIRHGVDPATNGITVTVTAERDGDDIRLRVRDSGRGIGTGKLIRGTGLSNTAERLRQLYGSRHKLELENCEGGGLLVTVAVPFHT